MSFKLELEDHATELRQSLYALLGRKALCDVTIICDGGKLSAHQVVLSASSPVLEGMFALSKEPHAQLLLKNISVKLMSPMVAFMYKGVVEIEEEIVDEFLHLAKVLDLYKLEEKLIKTGTVEKRKVAVEENETSKCNTAKKGKLDDVNDYNEPEMIIIENNPLDLSMANDGKKKAFVKQAVETQTSSIEFQFLAKKKNESGEKKSLKSEMTKCIICEKKIKKDLLRKHVRQKHDEKYVCQICDKECTTKPALVSHITNIHGK